MITAADAFAASAHRARYVLDTIREAVDEYTANTANADYGFVNWRDAGSMAQLVTALEEAAEKFCAIPAEQPKEDLP